MKKRKEAQTEVAEISSSMFREIVSGYSTGAIHWCKRFRPEMVEELATIEDRVNELARKDDVEGVKEELARCRKHVKMMITAFKVKERGKTV